MNHEKAVSQNKAKELADKVSLIGRTRLPAGEYFGIKTNSKCLFLQEVEDRYRPVGEAEIKEGSPTVLLTDCEHPETGETYTVAVSDKAFLKWANGTGFKFTVDERGYTTINMNKLTKDQVIAMSKKIEEGE